MTEAIIFGATGFVGRHVLEQLQAQTSISKITLLVRNISKLPNMLPKNVEVIQGELSNIPANLIPKNKDHCLVHYASKQIAGKNETYQENLENLTNVIKHTNAHTKGIIFGSSMSVYGQSAQLGTPENTELNPQTELAVNRVECENLLRVFSRDTGIKSVIFRSRFILGKDDAFTLPGWIKMVKSRTYLGDGKQAFSIISVKDYAEIISIIVSKLLQPENGELAPSSVFNIGYKKPLTYEELWKIISEYLQMSGVSSKKIPAKPVISICKILPKSLVGGLQTKLELMGLSHFGNVAALESIIGDKIIGKSPSEVLKTILNH